MAYMFLPMQTAAFATITPAEMGRATAVYNAQWQVGLAFGIAVMSTLLSVVGLTHPGVAGVPVPNLISYHMAFVAAAVLVLISVSFAFKVRDKEAVLQKLWEKQEGREASLPVQLRQPLQTGRR